MDVSINVNINVSKELDVCMDESTASRGFDEKISRRYFF